MEALLDTSFADEKNMSHEIFITVLSEHRN